MDAQGLSSVEAWDVVIAGAGPAGSTAALSCAAAGLRVLLVDRGRFPRAKVCGCCVSAAGVECLRKVRVAREVERSGAVRLSHVEIRSGGGVSRGRLPGGWAVSREILDTALVQRARECGVIVREGVSARWVAERDGWQLVACHGVMVRARVVIAADGLGGRFLEDHPALSSVRITGTRAGFGGSISSAAAAELALEPGVIRMSIGEGGYVGEVRLADGSIDIAASIDPGLVRQCGGPVQVVARLLGSAQGSRAALGATRWMGTPWLTRRRAAVEAPGVLVVGDSASYVEPFTGEGMTWAMESGLAVGAHAFAMVRGVHRLGAWTRHRRAMLGGRHRACWALSRSLRATALVRLAVPAARVMPGLISWPAAWIGRASTRRTATLEAVS